MLATDRRKLAMAARALEFARAYPSADASYMTLVQRLDDRVAQGDALAQLQEIGGGTEHSAVSHRNDVRETLERIQLRHLVRVAELAAKDHPELDGYFRAPRRDAPILDFINGAKVIVEAAEERVELFASCGLGDTFMVELRQAIAEFEQQMHRANAGRQDHIGATANLSVVAGECVAIVAILDGLYQLRFRRDTESLAAWNAARHVESRRRRQKELSGETVVEIAPVKMLVAKVREQLRLGRG